MRCLRPLPLPLSRKGRGRKESESASPPHAGGGQGQGAAPTARRSHLRTAAAADRATRRPALVRRAQPPHSATRSAAHRPRSARPAPPDRPPPPAPRRAALQTLFQGGTPVRAKVREIHLAALGPAAGPRAATAHWHSGPPRRDTPSPKARPCLRSGLPPAWPRRSPTTRAAMRGRRRPKARRATAALVAPEVHRPIPASASYPRTAVQPAAG